MSQTDNGVCPEQFRGWLLKWTNYIKGYQRRWFVLSNGLLSYYRTQEEMAHTCRGTVNLAGAFIDTIDATNFVITNGPSQVYHLRALNEVERQRWVTTLELAKSKAIKNLESDDSDSASGDEDEGGGDNPLSALKEKLDEVSNAQELMEKNSHQLLKFLSDLEEGHGRSAAAKAAKEKLTLFKLTSAALVKVSKEFVVQAHSTDRRWSRALQHEHSLRLELQENMEALANQMQGMENEAQMNLKVQGPFAQHAPATPSLSEASVSTTGMSSLPGGVDVVKEGSKVKLGKHVTVADEPDGSLSSDDEDKFFDAPEMSPEQWDRATSGGHKRNVSQVSVNELQAILDEEPTSMDILPVSSDRKMSIPVAANPNFFRDAKPTIAVRRTSIPPKPSSKLNLWSIMKNCIGKDLSKIPLPVNFNEPLSLLQRMMEEIYYADLLSRAAQAETTLEEISFLGAFVLSAYAHTIYRVGKPFNPLLGETYECDRRAEYGWRCFMEQVSHHPPMFAQYVEHKDWTFWQEFTAASKFRGKYLAVTPIGCCHIVFHRTKSHYTWGKAVVTVHNIIVGRLWIDQSGEVKIFNHTTNEECKIKFHAYSYFSRERQRKISGSVFDAHGCERYVIKGYWDEEFNVAPVTSGEGKNKEIGPFKQLWKTEVPQPGSELRYGFSEFAASLNEPERGVAPTDSRLRPDQRIMEEQDFNKANEEKIRLEEKQRAKRRKREAAASKAAEAAAVGNLEEAERLEKEANYSPFWFNKEYDPLSNTMMHVYKGGYWEAKERANWSQLNLPDLY